MAPEMIVMLNQPRYEKIGYTRMVDWWSMGVTLYRMLMGYRPFDSPEFTKFVELSTIMHNKLNEHMEFEKYSKLFQELKRPCEPKVSDEAWDLISQFLEVDEHKRLGSGRIGIDLIKDHPFFRNIEWNLLENKHLPPPEFEKKPPIEKPRVQNYEILLKSLKKDSWLKDTIPPSDQQFFQRW